MRRQLFVVLAVSLAGTTLLADDGLERDLQNLQGTWQRMGATIDGQRIMVRKVVTGNSEIVKYTDEQGTVLREHQADFRLELSGRARLFTYFNLLVTEGPSKGERRAEPSSYIYRLDADTFTEVHGMLVDDKSAVKMSTYKRVVR